MAIGLSAIAHAILLFGVAFKVAPLKIETGKSPLEVILVNSDSASQPSEPVAPASLKADKNIDVGEKDRVVRNRRSKAVGISSLGHSRDIIPARITEAESPETEVEQSKAPVEGPSDQDSPLRDTPPSHPQSGLNNSGSGTTELVQRGLEIARLQAQTVQNVAYQQSPKRKFLGTRIQDYRFARYVEDWRLKVERIGNLNYPEAAKREQLYGSLQLTVGIRSDGNLESIDINRSSGKRVLDEAAIRIVKLAGQNGFAPFPVDIGQEIDVLHITRTWVFTRADELTSE